MVDVEAVRGYVDETVQKEQEAVGSSIVPGVGQVFEFPVVEGQPLAARTHCRRDRGSREAVVAGTFPDRFADRHQQVIDTGTPDPALQQRANQPLTNRLAVLGAGRWLTVVKKVGDR